MLASRTTALGADHPKAVFSMQNLALAYKAAGKLDEAIALLREALEKRRTSLGPDHADTLKTLSDLASAYEAAGRLDQTLPLRRDAADLWRSRAGPGSPEFAGALDALGVNLLLQKRSKDAEPILRESLTIRETTQHDAWWTFSVKSLLGAALLGQKKYNEAEPLLRAGYEGMKQRADTMPSYARVLAGQALDRLIELSEATQKLDAARSWRDEKARWAAGSGASPDPAKR